MEKTLHDTLNHLAVAVATVHAFRDEKLATNDENLADLLGCLEDLSATLSGLRSESRAAGVPRSEGLLSAIVEGSPYAKVLVDAQGHISLVNAQTEKLFGYTRAELLGQSIEMLVPPRFRQGHAWLRDAFSGAPEARAMGAGRDLYGQRKDGFEVPIEIGLKPVETEAGIYTLAAITDIAERKRVEELRLLHAGAQQHATELEELNRELESASRFKTQFVASMSHELRTPLAAIVGAAELLSRTKLAEREQITVQTIREAAEALFALISSILDFSKIEAGKMDLQVSNFEVDRVVESAVEVVAQVARDKGIALHAFVDPSIPPVRGDGDRLRQILLNLLANAVKFTEHGRVLARAVPLDGSEDEIVVRFEVQDTGIGLASEVIPHLFEPFAQADRSTSRRFGGTGLGLSISKRLVKLMGGEIGLQSEPGSGSLFWFTARFERCLEEIQTHASALDGTPAGAPASAHVIRPVLVAEDDQRLQRLLKLQFDDLQIPVTFVSDGLQVIEALGRDQYSLVFMDCQMPTMDGLTATKAIRERERRCGGHVPIAAMTANAFTEDRDNCLAAGMDDYLAKPVKLDNLRAMIARWVK
jgi:PAS domain S-box-containing protein